MSSYRTVAIIFVAILAIGIGTPPEARQKEATHNIAWYAQNHAAREAMLRKCRSDMAMSRRVECLNAEAGSNASYSNRLNSRAWGGRS